ncbi:MAG: DUF1816 domain-containing protein [Pseudanabaenaceae cyanobacterium]
MSGKTSFDFIASILDQFGWAWWIKITTKQPHCTYYFGPFVTEAEAQKAQPGYIEDLQKEGAVDIQVELGRMRPDHNNLTIDESVNGSAPVLAMVLLSSFTSFMGHIA